MLRVCAKRKIVHAHEMTAYGGSEGTDQQF